MTLPLRRFVFWMHLVAGVSAGLVILLMSVTGVILAYEKQIIRWADDVSGPPATPGQPRLPLEDLVDPRADRVSRCRARSRHACAGRWTHRSR